MTAVPARIGRSATFDLLAEASLATHAVAPPSPKRLSSRAHPGGSPEENNMLRSIKQLAGCIAALTVIGTGAANAQADCPRGDLDKPYCDRNGDLVADAPTDPKQLINPSTLVFAYTPVEDPALY